MAEGGTGWTIVAVPSQDDYIWNISSEKIPHMTMLFLGEQSGEPDPLVVEFLQHVADTSMTRFGLSVDRRGKLGDNDADVLFFDKHLAQNIANVRSQMLQFDPIKRLYNSVEQYPEWTPHLTLGYPETPAKKDARDYPGTTWVNFDKLFFWTGDFTGIEFELKDNRDLETVSMSEGLDKVLAHHGIKGMKWGVRRSAVELKGARQEKKAAKEADKARPTSDDAARAGKNARIARNAGLSKLSNSELQHLVNRMNLEQQYSRLTPPTKGQKAKKIISDILLNTGKQQAQKFANDQVGAAIEKKTKK